MKPRDWCGVGLRLFGIWILTKGISYFLAVVYASTTRYPEDRTDWLVNGCLDLIMAGICLLGTDSLLNITYGKSKAVDKPESEKDTTLDLGKE